MEIVCCSLSQLGYRHATTILTEQVAVLQLSFEHLMRNSGAVYFFFLLLLLLQTIVMYCL